jgi:hypothetical protein
MDRHPIYDWSYSVAFKWDTSINILSVAVAEAFCTLVGKFIMEVKL